MEHYERILVALDLTDTDHYMVRFLYNHRSRLGPSAEFYFLHVEKDLDLPDEVMDLMGSGSADETIQDMMRKTVREGSADHEFAEQSQYIIGEGDVTDQMLHWAESKKVDLVVVGQKELKDGSGLAANKFARRSHCDILFLPAREVKVNNILVPVDFSKHSNLALEQAMLMGGHDAKITCLNIYTVPPGYTKVGKSFDEMAEIMKGHAQRELSQFMSSKQDTLASDTALSENQDFAHVIMKESERRGVDLVVIGSKGQTFVSWMLLGSVAEKTIMLSTHIPLLVVKQQEENFGFWKAIAQI